jgi:hypothetical protein
MKDFLKADQQGILFAFSCRGVCALDVRDQLSTAHELLPPTLLHIPFLYSLYECCVVY